LGLAWPAIEQELFADVIEFHRLERFPGYEDGAALLARYNVAQVQAALYRATSLKVWATEDFKTIVRYAKLARLMHVIRRLEGGGVLMHFDGPASVLRRTRRYGVAMARFLPALIACRGWKMQAVVAGRSSQWNWRLELSAEDGLRSHLPPPEEFDSSVERAFFDGWGSKPRDGWTLHREGDLLFHGQKAFVPDFVFEHQDGRRVFLEIVGFWTPEYLEAKINTLREFAETPMLLAVARQVGASIPELARESIPYKTSLQVEDVLARLAGI
jgi:predicted nuclease of restriction endonuclease-like RecB superfamily